jgi:hypothetical protein
MKNVEVTWSEFKELGGGSLEGPTGPAAPPELLARFPASGGFVQNEPGVTKPCPPIWLSPPPLEKGDRRARVARLDLGARYSGNTTELCSRFEMHARRMPVLRSQVTVSRMFV